MSGSDVGHGAIRGSCMAEASLCSRTEPYTQAASRYCFPVNGPMRSLCRVRYQLRVQVQFDAFPMHLIQYQSRLPMVLHIPDAMSGTNLEPLPALLQPSQPGTALS
eukprot:499605-Rhodomonas_salina.4